MGSSVFPRLSHLTKLVNIREIHSTLIAKQFTNWKELEEFAVLRDRLADDLGPNLEKLKEQNAYKLFNIEQKYVVDKSRLSREMRNLMKLLHPDKFVSSSRKVQILSDQLSALVNDHFRRLSNPYERGKYLLSIVSNKSLSIIEDQLDKVKVDPSFLAEMLDLRERLEDHLLDSEDLERVARDLNVELAQLTKEIEQNFVFKNEAKILDNLGKMKFLANCYLVAEDRLLRYDTV